MNEHPLVRAVNALDLETFFSFAFPAAWQGIAARIIETGAEFSPEVCAWSPRWSSIPRTTRKGDSLLENAMKSVIFRVHDCLHQLWGLPHPGEFSEEDFYYFKRSQMCGEVAVLTLTEFVFCDHLRKRFPEIAPLLQRRNALALLDGPLAGKSVEQIATRLDALLHRNIRPKWVLDDPAALAFVKDYVPMLERDRQMVDHNWALMRAARWCPDVAPRAKFGPNLDGLELTLWMIRDFEHLLSSSPYVDRALAAFNRSRRSELVLPVGWMS